MKRSLAVVGLTLISTSVLAGSTAGIYDLQYLPAAGTVYGESSYAVNDTSIRTDGVDSKINSNTFTQTIGYSVTERILLTASANYLLDESTSVERNKTGSDDGLSDPTIGARIRLMDQADSGLNFDILPSWTIETGDAEEGSGDKDGNNYSGGHTYGVNLNLGKKEKSHQWMVFLNSAMLGETESEDVTTKDKTKTDSTYNLTLGAQYLCNFNETTYLSGFFSAARLGELESKVEGDKTTTDARTSLNIGAEYGFTPTPNVLIAFALTAGKMVEYDVEPEGADKNTVEKERSASGILRARYQF